MGTLTAAQQREADKAARELAVANAAALDIASAVASEDISKAAKVYVEITPRAPMSNGAVATVHRERRTDDSLGEFLLAVVRTNPRDKSESVARLSIETVQLAVDALAAVGVRIVSVPEIKVPA